MTQTLHISPVFTDIPIKPNRTFALWKFVALSLLVHILGFWAISYSARHANTVALEVNENVRSYLVLSPPQKPMEIVKPIQPKLEKAQIQNQASKPTKSESPKASTKTSLPINETVNEAKLLQNTNNKAPNEGVSKYPNQADLFSKPRYLQVDEQTKLDALSAYEASEARRAQRAPDLNLPTITELQEREDAPAFKPVNCSTTVNKTISVLAGFTGGRMNCSRPPDINQFINARKNKSLVVVKSSK